MYRCSSLPELAALLLPVAAELRFEALEIETTCDVLSLVVASIQATSHCPSSISPLHASIAAICERLPTCHGLPWLCGSTFRFAAFSVPRLAVPTAFSRSAYPLWSLHGLVARLALLNSKRR
ncbi:MAG: hypothetical protein AVDCRST_MAG93-3063 [uncultured Chloroflexia bacterium]|uniref:Uncharacterized protein n=1 Tax=uncultured Chloroflexia bacterium TaxID=1672391 RepID=A0A6J4JFA4_9CHLR|nr:MAG: hypothetical protein AVDCRST_MAG93-3063 [uncultured Chloroflexia bacterium]